MMPAGGNRKSSRPRVQPSRFRVSNSDSDDELAQPPPVLPIMPLNTTPRPPRSSLPQRSSRVQMATPQGPQQPNSPPNPEIERMMRCITGHPIFRQETESILRIKVHEECVKETTQFLLNHPLKIEMDEKSSTPKQGPSNYDHVEALKRYCDDKFENIGNDYGQLAATLDAENKDLKRKVGELQTQINANEAKHAKFQREIVAKIEELEKKLEKSRSNGRNGNDDDDFGGGSGGMDGKTDEFEDDWGRYGTEDRYRGDRGHGSGDNDERNNGLDESGNRGSRDDDLGGSGGWDGRDNDNEPDDRMDQDDTPQEGLTRDEDQRSEEPVDHVRGTTPDYNMEVDDTLDFFNHHGYASPHSREQPHRSSTPDDEDARQELMVTLPRRLDELCPTRHAEASSPIPVGDSTTGQPANNPEVLHLLKAIHDKLLRITSVGFGGAILQSLMNLETLRHDIESGRRADDTLMVLEGIQQEISKIRPGQDKVIIKKLVEKLEALEKIEKKKIEGGLSVARQIPKRSERREDSKEVSFFVRTYYKWFRLTMEKRKTIEDVKRLCGEKLKRDPNTFKIFLGEDYLANFWTLEERGIDNCYILHVMEGDPAVATGPFLY